jgi:hypothetical protein
MRGFGGEQKRLSHPSPVATCVGCSTNSTFYLDRSICFITLPALGTQKKRVVYGIVARHEKGLTFILHR